MSVLYRQGITDATAMYVDRENIEQTTYDRNRELKQICELLIFNKLKLNLKITKAMLLTSDNLYEELL